MKTLLGLLLMLTMPLTIGCGSNSGGDSRLQGTWKYKQIVNAGKETPAELLDRAPTVTFEGNKMITKEGDKVVETWTYKTRRYPRSKANHGYHGRTGRGKGVSSLL